MDRIKHNIRIFIRILENCSIRELNFRINTLIRLCTDLVWYVINIIFFEIIYLNIKDIQGWNRWEVVLFLGTLFIIDSIHMSVFYFNVFNIPNHVRRGTLDGFLLKPVSAKYLISVRNISLSSLGNVIFGIFLVVLAANKLQLPFSIIHLLGYLLLLINGVVIMYSSLFLMATLSIYFIRTEGIMNMLFEVFQFGMKPDMIYQGASRFILTYII
ncbi:MAG: ABC-2 family transporter protein, partial [Halanaerobiales bacterium]|nr:ABC-2 family transporter protein [Halanaerobiales bacterium]